jgi:hypothetical protein
MNEQHFGKRIKETLDQGLHVSPAVEARLRASRALALERHAALEQRWSLANLIGGNTLRLGGPGGVGTRVLLPMAIVIAGLAGVTYYRDYQARIEADQAIEQQAAEIEEIDSKVLTSDIPFRALLDEDFQAWLKRSKE